MVPILSVPMLVQFICSVYLFFVLGPFLLYLVALTFGFTTQPISGDGVDDTAIYRYDRFTKSSYPVVAPGMNRWGAKEQEGDAGKVTKKCPVTPVKSRFMKLHLSRNF